MSGLYSWITSGDASTPLQPGEDAATPDDAAATAPDDAARQRPSRAATAQNAYNLRVRTPTEGRSTTPQQRLRDRVAARSPSPSLATPTSTFTFPTATMDADAIRALVQETLRASTTAAVTAVTTMLPDAVRDVTRDQVRDVTALTRKPELPAFDSANIEIWIRRIENAFTRASITAVKDKFAFLESKIGTNTDPKITEFLCVNPPTNATWDEFLIYLRRRYGRTKRQQVQSLISGTDFDGLHPSAVCSMMKEKAGSVTIDDIIKEQLYRRLPVELQRQLAQEYESLTAPEFAELADGYFDKDGRPLHATAAATGVNSIGGGVSNAPSTPTRPSTSSSTASGFTTAFESESSDVNAVRSRPRNNNNNNNSRPAENNSYRNNNNNNNNNDHITVYLDPSH